MWFYHSSMHPKDADTMANSVESKEPGSECSFRTSLICWGSSLTWVYTVFCPDLSVQILGIIMIWEIMSRWFLLYLCINLWCVLNRIWEATLLRSTQVIRMFLCRIMENYFLRTGQGFSAIFTSADKSYLTYPYPTCGIDMADVNMTG